MALTERPHRRKFPAYIRGAVYRRAKHRCFYCDLKFPATDKSMMGLRAPRNRKGVWLEVDHIVPYSHGGTDDISNIRAACSTCNNSRGVDPSDIWGARRMVPNGT